MFRITAHHLGFILVFLGAAVQPAHPMVPQTTTPIGETGTVTVDQTGATQWRTITLVQTYTSPVVIMQPLSFNGGDPSTVRLRNVTATGFDYQIDEWDYLDQSHITETWSYLVLEQGMHTLDNGALVEVGTASVTDAWAAVTLSSAFAAPPVVVSQSQTVNEASAIATRQQNITTGGFSVRLQEEEVNGAHAAETVGWVAIEAGTGTTGGAVFEAGLTPNIVTDAFYSIAFAQTFAAAPTFVASMQTFNGGDTATLRYQNLAATGVDVFVEEEISLDTETTHVTEVVGYVLFPLGTISITSTGPPPPPPPPPGAASTREGKEDCGCSSIAAVEQGTVLSLALALAAFLLLIRRRTRSAVS